MKKRIFAVASLVAFCSLGATQVVRAQEPVRVNIPFAFTVGEETLPPGEYRVEKLNEHSQALLIRSTEPGVSAMVPSIAAESRAPQTQSKLVFHRYNNTYFLAEVWSAGSTAGRQLLNSSREKEIALSSKAETRSDVILLARLAPAKP